MRVLYGVQAACAGVLMGVTAAGWRPGWLEVVLAGVVLVNAGSLWLKEATISSQRRMTGVLERRVAELVRSRPAGPAAGGGAGEAG